MKDILATYAPSVLLYGSITGAEFLSNHDFLTRRQKTLAKSYEITKNSYDKYKSKVLYRFVTNNYRKHHHLPMRRKGV